jgi:flagellin-like hook-associated protein FlgL
MRLSFNMKFNAGLDGMLNTQNKMNRAQDQLTKQTRILTPADDPAASAKVLGLDQNLQQVAQFQNNSVRICVRQWTELVCWQLLQVMLPTPRLSVVR